MNIEKVKELQETIEAIMSMNLMKKESKSFLYIMDDGIMYENYFRPHNLEHCKGIVVLGTEYWRNGDYTNARGRVIVMVDKYYSIVEDIRITKDLKLLDITFSRRRSSYYDEFKPSLVVQNMKTGENIKLELEEEASWTEEFQSLFRQAFSLNTEKNDC